MATKTIDLDLIFQALADPTRRAVVERLGAGPGSMSELAAPFDMALPSFLQHLKVLEACGLVTSAKKGRVRTYQISKRSLSALEVWLEKQHLIWTRRLDQMDAYLKTMK